MENTELWRIWRGENLAGVRVQGSLALLENFFDNVGFFALGFEIDSYH